MRYDMELAVHAPLAEAAGALSGGVGGARVQELSDSRSSFPAILSRGAML